MKGITRIRAFVLAVGLVGLLSGAVAGGEYTYTFIALDGHDFQPARNTYQWRCNSHFEGQTGQLEFTIHLTYFKVPNNLKVEISSHNTASGDDFSGVFEAPCSDDPVLFDNVTCGPYQKKSGNNNALPSIITYDHKPLSVLGSLLVAPATRQALLQEYLGIIEGPFTLAPMPVSPGENAKVHSPVVFEAFLPFRVALPCGGWSLTLLLERSDPAGGNYPWIKVDTGKVIKGWEGDHFQCRFKKEMALAPGKYRFKLQAAHFQHGKTPWSLPFEFTVTLKLKPGITAASHFVVTAPTAGAIWRIRSEPYYVNWKTFGLPAEVLNGPVKIVLWRGSQRIRKLRKGITAKTGAARVYLKDDLPTGGDFFIRIRSLVNTEYSADSGRFSIVKITPQRRFRQK